jgi:hypothetical protein
MKNILLFFCVASILVVGGCSKKSEYSNVDAFEYKYKKVLKANCEGNTRKKEIKLQRLDNTPNTSVRQELDAVTDWIAYVGEAMDMME